MTDQLSPVDGPAATIDAVLAAVGDDAGLAAAFLEAEQGAAQPRVSLVPRLEAIATPAAADDTSSQDPADVEVELLGVSHNAKAGDVVLVTDERADELVHAGLARRVDA